MYATADIDMTGIIGWVDVSTNPVRVNATVRNIRDFRLKQLSNTTIGF